MHSPSLRQFILALLVSGSIGATAQAQFVAFNDHAPGTVPDTTAANTTTYDILGAGVGSTGALKDISSGSTLPVTVTITRSGTGVAGAANAGSPAAGTPLYNTFNGFVDFQGTPSPAIQVTGSAGGFVTYTFNNLDPNKRYNFKGSAVRGGADGGTTFYSTRWTLFEITGAASFTSAHTVNALTTTQAPALTAGQVAINTGINNTPTTGDMADWENIDPGPDGIFAVTSTQYTGTVPGGASDGPYCYALTGFRLEEINNVQTAAAITNQPQGQLVSELQPATFSVGVSGNPRPTVQWYKNNNSIQDATNLTYRIASALLSDSGASFKVVANNIASNISYSVTSSVVTLTVNADTNAPTLVRAVTLSATQVQVTFSEPVDSVSANNVTNYTITATNGNLSLSNATLQAGQTNVIITTSTQLPGTLYTLRASNIRDISTAANPIATNSQTTFTTAAGYIPNDIGAPGTAGSATPVVNGYDVVGSGNDIGGSGDQFMFAALQRSGDFDVKVRVESLSLTDPWAKAGLMARQNLTTNSQYAAVFATPTLSGCFYNWRATSGGGGTNNAGSFPVNYPYTWLRLQRTNSNTYIGYASLDGITWALLGSSTVSMTDPIYFGYAVTSRSNAIPATARFRDTENIIGPSIVKPFSSRIEPLGPSSRKTGLVITEIMYKPVPRTDNRNVEFIEIYNSNPYYEDISNYRIAGDIDYTFPAGTILQGGAFLVIAKVPADVQSVYGISNVTGPYTGSLKTSSTVRLRNQVGTIYLDVTYDNKPPWPVAADNTGHSLVLARPSYGEGYAQAWAASDSFGGSPGGPDPVGPETLRAVVINEFLAHTDDPSLDYVELYNHSNQAVDLSGAYLSDEATTNKFRIPALTVLPARGFISFDQNQLGFSLNAEGETIYLVNSSKTRVIDAVQFEGQANGVPMGRYPDGADNFYPLIMQTPGDANASTRILVNDIVINEIMFAPISGDSNDEYVELYNKGTNAVNLGGWKFTSGINFIIPANTVIASNGYLVVAKFRTNIFQHYNNLNSGNTVGDYGGTLANGGERIVLAMPDYGFSFTTNAGQVTTNISINYVPVDEVTYGSGGKWGNWSAGGGSSLELIDPRSNHRLPSNWADSDESLKATWTTIEATGVLDLGSTWTSTALDRLEVTMLNEGECLIDNVEVIGVNGTNLLTAANSTFETGIASWVPQGNHVRSTLENEGYSGSARSLHIRASSRGDSGANRIRVALATATTAGTTNTIRAQVRWIAGWPEVLLRLKGNYLEATGRLIVPPNLGTPGARNSRALPNAGPAIYEVTHSPVLPATAQPVVVTARVDDPDGLTSLVVRYRNDTTNSAYSTATMVDDGTAGDTVANDGIYSGTIPGQVSGTMIAFYVQAADNATPPVTNIFPAQASATGRECLVRFGDPVPTSSYGVYRYWMTQNSVSTWANRPSLSNERVEGTFVYGNYRVIYNMSGKYSGSPYHQNLGASPVANTCHYSLEMPADDLLLGTDNFGKIHAPGNGNWDDPTIQREQAGYWLLRQMNLPWNYRRYINFVINGNRRSPTSLMEDTQTPSSEVINAVFPDDPDGYLFKLQPWFEFDDVTVTGTGAAGFENKSWCLLNNQTTINTATGGSMKKLARLRQTYLGRAANGTANDYSAVYTLVDTASTPSSNPKTFSDALESIVDVEQWMRTFAVEHAVGNWDSVGNRNSQNMYGYKPLLGKWQLLVWDLNILLNTNTPNNGAVSDAPGANLFQYQTADTNMAKIYANPTFRRAYLRSLKEIANGPMANIDPMLDAKYATFVANGLGANITAPTLIKTFVANARSAISTQVAAEDSSTFTITGGGSLTTANNLFSVSGVAPVEVKTIRINGTETPVTWTSVSNWTLRVAVSAASSVLAVQGYDLRGNALSNALASLTVNYTGVVAAPQDALVLNEIMYHPANPLAAYLEIFNSSANFSFDLSGWRLNGLDYTFPPGSFITNRQYLILAKNRAAFAATYGAGIAVAGEYAGDFDLDGETLSLLKVAGTNETVIDRVRYEAAPPWPANANGQNASLQLVDASQDNARVSNWSDGSNWRFVVITNWKGSSTFSFYLAGQGGDIYLDNVAVVRGNLPEVGSNYVRNGTFETGTLSPWIAKGSHSNSVVSGTTRFDGGYSLHLIGSSAGSGQSEVGQTLSGLSSLNTYTVSFWYLPSSTATGLFFHLGGTNATLDVRAGNSYSPGAINSVAGSIVAYPPLWLNEVLATPTTNSLADRLGEREPWIELYNSGTNTLALDGFYLASSYATPSQWAFPPGSAIGPGEFKVIFADGQPGQTLGGEWHTSFRLNGTNGSLALTRNQQVLDYLNYTNLGGGVSYGDAPDGQLFDRQLFYFTTPGASNNPALVPVAINEWLASNTGGLTNPATGHFDDWFELYNFGAAPVDLSGFYLTDDLDKRKNWRVPNGTVLAPGGFLLVWADNDGTGTNRTGNALHASFQLSKSRDEIGLYSPEGLLVDAVSFSNQVSNVSQGRYPDGNFGGVFYSMPTTTPSGPNSIGGNAYPPVLPPIANRAIAEGSTLLVTNSASDADLPAQSLTYSLDVTAPFGAAINSASGLFAWTPNEAQGGATYPIAVRVTDNGSPSLSATQTFLVTVTEVNSPPALDPVAGQSVDENTLLTLTLSASDSDLPAQSLAYALLSAPANATLDNATGEFNWTPSEAQGPSTNLVRVRVTDNGAPPLSATQSFSLVVREVNSAPTLLVPASQSVAELSTLTLTNQASDSDLPANTLTYALLGGPTNATLDSATGLFTWTPSETQGGTTNPVTVKVSDNGTPSLSATQSFTLIVTEVNAAPTFTNSPAGPLVIPEHSTLTLTNQASDSDLPANTLTYALLEAPAGATLDSATGLFTWTPDETRGGTTNPVTIKVSDNGTPSLSATQSFTLIVTEVNAAPVLAALPDRVITAGLLLSVTNQASDSDLPANTLTFALLEAPGGATLDSATGLFTWTPGPTQAATTNSVTLQVTDNGSPSLSATQSFTVRVLAPPPLSVQSPATPGEATLSWPSQAGQHYRLEYKNTLSEPQWLPLPGAGSLEATGSLTTFTDSFPQATTLQRFYHLQPLD